MSTPELRTRPPTGMTPWPLVLLEGREKTGKSFTAAQFTADERIDRAFWFDLGEGAADEYAELGDYEVVVHNGSYHDFLGQVEAAVSQPRDGDRPNAIVVDSITALWSLLCDMAQREANERAAAKARKYNKPAPVGEVQITMDLWNTAKGRWRKVMNLLMTYDGPVVLTARGGEVTEMDGGAPTKNKIWKVQGEKNLCYDVTVWIRYEELAAPQLVGVRSLDVAMPDEGETRPLGGRNFDLATFVFETMDCSTGRELSPLEPGAETVKDAKNKLYAWLKKDAARSVVVWQDVLGDDFDAPSVTADQLEQLRKAAQKALADQADDTDDTAEEQDAEVAA